MKLSGTIGDIVVTENSQAVEVKFNHPITFNNLPEPIGEDKGSSVSHYYLLSKKIIYLNDEIKLKSKSKNCSIKMTVKLLPMDFFRLLVMTYVFYRTQLISSKYKL